MDPHELVTLSGWAIAQRVGCHYDGDSDPIQHGGFFYDIRDWDRYGYASVVEFWLDPETKNTLIVQEGTINKPADFDELWKPDTINGQIVTARNTVGIEPNGTSYPAISVYNLDEWKEWRIWKSVIPRLMLLSNSPNSVCTES